MTDYNIHRLSQIERVNVIGTSGSGKSTFGRQLSEILGLPFFEMDRVYWRPHWGEPTDEEFLPQVQAITERSRWVLDGNYSRTTPVKWQQVQLVVWLDLSFARTLYRVSARSLKRSLTKEEIWPETDNRETLRKSFFSRDSVILWAVTTYRSNRQRYAEMFGSQEYANIWFVRLTSRRDVNCFLEAARLAARSLQDLER